MGLAFPQAELKILQTLAGNSCKEKNCAQPKCLPVKLWIKLITTCIKLLILWFFVVNSTAKPINSILSL